MAEQSSRLSRRWLYIPWIIAGVLLTAYFFAWRYAAGEMTKAVDVWIEDQRAAGLTVTHGEIKSAGFPFFLRVLIDDPAIAAPGTGRWGAERLALDALPYDLNRLIFSPMGAQQFQLQGIGAWAVTADDLRASIANDKTRGWLFALTIGEAKLHRAFDNASIDLGALVLDFAPAPNDLTTLTLNLATSDLAVIDGGETYTIDTFNAALSMTQTHALSMAAPAASWRGAGGAFIINALEANIDDAKILADGRITLDRALFPSGAINTEIQNPAPIVASLSKAGILNPEDADAAAAGLTLMAMTGGGKIIAPIQLKKGEAILGGVKIANLSPVE